MGGLLALCHLCVVTVDKYRGGAVSDSCGDWRSHKCVQKMVIDRLFFESFRLTGLCKLSDTMPSNATDTVEMKLGPMRKPCWEKKITLLHVLLNSDILKVDSTVTCLLNLLTLSYID